MATTTHSMDAVILVGGFGTRLKSVSNGTPKSLMNVGDGVFLDVLLHRLVNLNLKRVFLSVHYGAQQFIDYAAKADFQFELIPVVEPEPLGTGGAIAYLLSKYNISSPFFVMNGDSHSNIDLNEMRVAFDETEVKAMLGLSEVENVFRYGSVELENTRVICFREKGETGRGLINNGVYLFQPELFDGLTGALSLEADILPALVEHNELDGFKVVDDSFIDIGVPDDYLKFSAKGVTSE